MVFFGDFTPNSRLAKINGRNFSLNRIFLAKYHHLFPGPLWSGPVNAPIRWGWTKMTAILNDYRRFFLKDLWETRLTDLPRSKAVKFQILRVLVLTGQGLVKERWSLRASALTYYSLMSIVPALAVAFGVAKGFGLETTLEEVLRERLAGHEEIVSRVVVFARNMLENVQGGLMAGVSLLVLFWAVFQVLSHIENAFNDIWRIRQARRLARQLTDYLAVTLVCSFFLMVSSTLTIFITGEIRIIVQNVSILEALSPVIYFLMQLSPFWVMWLLLGILYAVMPNTRVPWRAAMWAGMMSGTLFQVFQIGYIHAQIFLTGYNAIYGSFAALPLFFIWLQVSWLIVLMGAEFCRALQTVDEEAYYPGYERNSSWQRLLALRIVQILVQRFGKGQAGNALELAKELALPVVVVAEMLIKLSDSGIVAPVGQSDDGDPEYQPAIDPERLTIKYIVDNLEGLQALDGIWLPGGGWEALADKLRHLDRDLADSAANVPLKDLAHESVQAEVTGSQNPPPNRT